MIISYWPVLLWRIYEKFGIWENFHVRHIQHTHCLCSKVKTPLPDMHTLYILALTYFSNISLYNSSTCFLRFCVQEFLRFNEYFTPMLLIQSHHLWWCGVLLSPSSKLLVSFQIQLHYCLPQHLHTWGHNWSIMVPTYLHISKFFVSRSLCLGRFSTSFWDSWIWC